MATKYRRPKGWDGALSSLNLAIDKLNLAKLTSVAQAKAAFGSASDLLIDSMIDKEDFVELGLTCADICEALDRGTDGRRADQLSPSVLEAIEKLTTTVDWIQANITKRGRRNAISRRFHAKEDKEVIAAWRLDMDSILCVFNAELGVNSHATVPDIRQDVTNTYTTGSDVHWDIPNPKTIAPDVHHNVSNTNPIVPEVRSDAVSTRTVVSDAHRNKLKGREDLGGHHQATHARAPGDSPPPLPRNTQGTSSDIRRNIVNIETMVSDIRRDMLKSREEVDGQHRSAQDSIPGESPPPPPRACFGRAELIEKIVGLAQNLTPIALIGPGGIGKTFIALTVLHDDRIKQQFGDNRWFLRCDQFPASCTHFLRRLSEVTGAGIENPEDLAPLRRHLSSKEMLIVLDNAESILGLQGKNGQEIYAVVDELSQFNNICLCITSRITTVPPNCKNIDIPTLPVEAGHDTFYRIYEHGERSDVVNDILEQLDFHPLSITLLATVAQHNRWDFKRLTKEWERRRTGVLHAQHSGSLATAIELSLTSAMFQELGPDARGVLGVIAFFPQGVDEENVDWLFPTIPDGSTMFDRFCTLSLTYRSNGFVMMLAPLRDYLLPKDPASSPLLCATKECYFTRLSVDEFDPDRPGFGEARWITSEDVNVEHLLDTFTSIDGNSRDIWGACVNFIYHLYWHKPRLVMLGPRIEALPDDHPSKAECLESLSSVFDSVGNNVEQKRLLDHALTLRREQGNDHRTANALSALANANRLTGQCKEGIQQGKEAAEIFERLGDTVKQAQGLVVLAWLLHDDGQLDTAEEAAFRAIDLLPGEGEQHLTCRAHHALGVIHYSKGKALKAIHHFQVALKIASSPNWIDVLFWAHYKLAQVFFGEANFDEAHAHIEYAKAHTVDDVYYLGCAMDLQAYFWYKRGLFQGAKSEASRAADIFEKLGAARALETCRELLRWIDEEMDGPVVFGGSDSVGQETG